MMQDRNETDSRALPRIFVVCDQTDTAPVWGYILRQQGLRVTLETLADKAINKCAADSPDLIVLDLDPRNQDPLQLSKRFRAVSAVPVILLFPAYHETQILDAYAAGMDDVVVKPITPAIFLAKIMAWIRRGGLMTDSDAMPLTSSKHRLDLQHRYLVTPHGEEINLTTLEFQLLQLLMSRPEEIFTTDEIVRTIWGPYGSGDTALLKNIVYRLRKKIEADPSHPILLQTWPRGYSFRG